MNKREISERMYKKLNIRKFEAYSFIDLMLEVVSENLQKKKKVVISNFGAFKVIERREKRVINPNTQEEMTIKARKVVKFFPSENLKKKINGR